MEELVNELMAAIDTNKDNRIDLREMAQLLPTDEEFILLFQRDNKLSSSVDFMKVWKEFDKDHSGYIEADELKLRLAGFMATKIFPLKMSVYWLNAPLLTVHSHFLKDFLTLLIGQSTTADEAFEEKLLEYTDSIVSI
ncbi:hypothetical protein AHF37_00509 [Paragonimus kellicotti]|nr:hypothetical protein AHF37_00509 [Paragonimus kellicotti]